MNAQLEDDVRSAIERDPRILDPIDIAVSGDGGIVTLRGNVRSFKQRRAAVEDAKKIAGVYEVIDELVVHLRDDVWDDEIRGAAIQSLIWDADVPAERIEVKVSAGWVTLTGTVDYEFQSDAAFDDVAMIKGVGAITNKIKVVTVAS
jgi:osmotically-inducible protein OsmY